MRVAMIGGGYVGLVSGACFAELGTDVAIVETHPGRLAALKRGEIPIYEPGLDKLVADNAAAGRLTFGDDIAEAVRGAEVVFIAVGTPSRRGDGHADLDYVYAAARQIGAALSDHAVIVTKSTVPVGTGRTVARIIRETRPDADFDIASNPEFLREGSAIVDFMRPDRVIIGLDTDAPDGAARAREILGRLYRPLYLIEAPVVFSKLETAELIKYASNAFLAMKVTFINEMADLCEATGADVHDLAKGMGMDGRIGRKFLHAGPGFGGSCFPKDTLALAAIARDAGAPTQLIDATIRVNNARKQKMADRVIGMFDGDITGKTIGVLGLTFKPDTDDMREASSIPILNSLAEAGGRLRVFDPAGMENAKPHLPDDVTYCHDAIDALTGVDALLVLTEWKEFRALSPAKLRGVMKGDVLVDLRNIFDPVAMRAAGFRYTSIGRE